MQFILFVDSTTYIHGEMYTWHSPTRKSWLINPTLVHFTWNWQQQPHSTSNSSSDKLAQRGIRNFAKASLFCRSSIWCELGPRSFWLRLFQKELFNTLLSILRLNGPGSVGPKPDLYGRWLRPYSTKRSLTGSEFLLKFNKAIESYRSVQKNVTWYLISCHILTQYVLNITELNELIC